MLEMQVDFLNSHIVAEPKRVGVENLLLHFLQ